MFLKPRRFKTTLAFFGGLSISLVLLAGGLFWYQQQQSAMREKIGLEIQSEIESEWQAANPLEVVYVFTADMKAGTVLDDQDLILKEIGSGAIPADAVRTPEEAIGRVIRNDVRANTLCMQSLIYQQGNFPDDARIQEYSAIRLPQRLEKNETIDVRVMFPNGLDYVVLSKKNVLDLQRDETGIGNLVWLTMSEEELLRMSSAVVDAFLHAGTMLYAVTYVAPDVQAAATVTYPANGYVQDLIQTNPNIVMSAVNALERANRKWFDSIPDPQPQQPLAVVPAPSGAADAEADVLDKGDSDTVSGTVSPDNSGVKGSSPKDSTPITTDAEGTGSTGGTGSSGSTETTNGTEKTGSTGTPDGTGTSDLEEGL